MVGYDNELVGEVHLHTLASHDAARSLSTPCGRELLNGGLAGDSFRECDDIAGGDVLLRLVGLSVHLCHGDGFHLTAHSRLSRQRQIDNCTRSEGDGLRQIEVNRFRLRTVGFGHHEVDAVGTGRTEG